MNTFVDAINTEIDEAPARTENGMKARASTANAVLDYFAKAGSSRGVDLKQYFSKALTENQELAVRALLWTRDVRGGAGERKQFRDQLQVLENADPDLAGSLIPKILEVGRWDDLFSFQNPLNVLRVLETFAQGLREGNGLAAKWTPRRNKWFHLIRSHMGLGPRQFRKLIVGLTNVVETPMSAKEWNTIDFSKVPSLASSRYQKAFSRNAGAAYAEYLSRVKKGEAKIHAGAVFPYDVVKAANRGNTQAADLQWEALPDFLNDSSVFPIMDTSGSMTQSAGDSSNVTALDVAISLGLYVAAKNKSAFKDLLMIFSQDARMVRVKGSLSQRMLQLPEIVSSNTNLNLAFEKLLGVAKEANVDPADMPKVLLIMSDMQFDSCVNYDDSAIEMIRREYQRAGYRMPKIVFWNLGRNYYGTRDNVPVRFDENGTALVSGFSPAILKSVLSDTLDQYTPLNVMMETLMNPRYDY